MKKYLLPSLIAVVALSSPLVALAQTSPILGTQQQSQTTAPSADQSVQSTPAGSTYSEQQQTQVTSPGAGLSSQQAPMTQNSSQTSQTVTPNTSVGSQQQSVTQSQSAVTQQSTSTAQTATTMAFPGVSEVIVGTDSASSITPPLHIGLGTTAINVVNPTPKLVTFTVPTLNISYEVPANSQRLVQIDPTQTANLTAGQSVAYYINDSNGNQIASGNFYNYQLVASHNTYTQYASESKEEPKYTSKNYSRSRSTVRGYW